MKKRYWELTEADGITHEQVIFNRRLHLLYELRDRRNLFFSGKMSVKTEAS